MYDEEKRETLFKGHTFIQAAMEACGDVRGQLFEFVCPICGGSAYATRASINGHLHAECDSCKIRVME